MFIDELMDSNKNPIPPKTTAVFLYLPSTEIRVSNDIAMKMKVRGIKQIMKSTDIITTIFAAFWFLQVKLSLCTVVVNFFLHCDLVHSFTTSIIVHIAMTRNDNVEIKILLIANDIF